jgi:hypothetical protein
MKNTRRLGSLLCAFGAISLIATGCADGAQSSSSDENISASGETLSLSSLLWKLPKLFRPKPPSTIKTQLGPRPSTWWTTWTTAV